MTAARQSLGRQAEELVASRLARAGWRVLERNARTRYGELDVVALEDRTLVFVEVRATRSGAAVGPERPVLSIGPRKQRQVRRLATAWLAERSLVPRHRDVRFDAVGVTYDAGGRPLAVEHIRGAF